MNTNKVSSFLKISLPVLILVVGISYTYYHKTSYVIHGRAREIMQVAEIVSYKNDPSECTKIKISKQAPGGSNLSESIDLCYLYTAIDLNDPSICQLITHPSFQESCVQQVEMLRAYFEKCDTLIKDKKECYAVIIASEQMHGTPGTCQLPYFPKEWQACYEKGLLNYYLAPSYSCVLDDPLLKNACHYLDAVIKKNVSICNNIDSPFFKEKCVSGL